MRKGILMLPCLLALAAAMSGCSKSTMITLHPPEITARSLEETYPLRAAAVIDPALFSYQILCKESPATYEYMVRGIPTYYVQMLSSVFKEVEIIQSGEDILPEDFDVVARLSIGQEERPGFQPREVCPYLLFDFLLTDLDGRELAAKKGRVAKEGQFTHEGILYDLFTDTAFSLKMSPLLRNYSDAVAPGQTRLGPPVFANRFEARENGVIYDRQTDMAWFVGPHLDWEGANRWIRELEVAGGGWRLPTLSELQTLHLRPPDPFVNLLLKTTGAIWSGADSIIGAQIYSYHSGEPGKMFENTPVQTLAIRSGK